MRVCASLDDEDAGVESWDVDIDPVPALETKPEWTAELSLIRNGLGQAVAEEVSVDIGRSQLYKTRDMTSKHAGIWARIDRHGCWHMLTLVSASTEAAALKIGSENFQREFARAAAAGMPYERAGALCVDPTLCKAALCSDE